IAAVEVLDGATGGKGNLQVGVDGLLRRAGQVEADAGGGAAEVDGVGAGGVGDGVVTQGGVGLVEIVIAAGAAGERVVARAAGELVGQRLDGASVVAIAAGEVLEGSAGGQGQPEVGVDRLRCRAGQLQGHASGGAGKGHRINAGGVGDGIVA